VTIDDVGVSAGWECPPNQPYIKELLVAASERSFGKPALGLNEGGSIPLMTTLQNLYCLELNFRYPKSQFIVTGVLGPGSNAHGPNEFLHVPYTKKLITGIADFVASSYKHFSKK
jgi:acetylornithine deacetylase/succinyl-diaminopimelate desuccinylase-like protein